MIEMDQFAVTLSGADSDIIERQSMESAATMKDVGKTIEEFVIIIFLKVYHTKQQTWEEVDDGGTHTRYLSLVYFVFLTSN